ncbi:hypothetical protein [Massilia sp. BJB1822]|uniref:hypothetical protein n=1 Tax=Massilia sp. BJB1822 TaxID=2744470 RepID=UPI0015937999|nr:hypothetical protein [Massilia sp. BJB1822]NVE01633.1 hypothetical protein [Massilia sp. BJB1822]
MKATIFAAVLGLSLAGCASTEGQDSSARNMDDSYTPTGSHIARKTVDRSSGVQMVNKEEFQRSIEMNNSAVSNPGSR